MNQGKRGNRTYAPQEWDKPLAKWMRRLFWKGERREQAAALPERLVDDYTRRESMADICTPEAPCERCQQRSR